VAQGFQADALRATTVGLPSGAGARTARGSRSRPRSGPRLRHEWLEAQAVGGQKVLDYGCGSGILALAALVLGASRAAAFDIDPQALTATRENAQKNGLSERIHVVSDAARLDGPFDFVLANILSGTLVELAPRLAALCRPRGSLALAGMLALQAREVAEAYRPWFDIESAAEREGWSLLAGRRRPE
jgi:ribosomal protein L11 methyltransferase